MDICLQHTPLSPDENLAAVSGPDCGGVVQFVGSVRHQTQGKQVRYLEFESYEPMAIKEMKKIAEEAKARFGIHRLSIHHRLGRVELGEAAVCIAAAAPHRKAAFEACAFAIDTLKETVPIWKKEFFVDGAVWVSATP